MHRLGPGLATRLDNAVDGQIGERRRCRPDAHRFVCLLDVQRVLVRFGVDGHRLDTHLASRADHPTGDFTAIGNQDFLEHVVLTSLNTEDTKTQRTRRKGNAQMVFLSSLSVSP